MKWLSRLLGGTEPTPPVDFAALLKESRKHLEKLTFMHQTNWRLGRQNDFNLDTETRNLRFTFADGDVVVCSAQAVGSYDADGKTRFWAWANQSLAPFPAFLKYAAEVRDYGCRHRVAKLVEPAWRSDLEEAWSMTAFAVQLCGGKGAFSVNKGPLHMFLAFEEVSLSKFAGIEELLDDPGK
jgi:hypothetical protein